MVQHIERVRPEAPGAVESVRVTFLVTDGIRGAKTGETLAISEWAGLWASGERYRAGQRLMLFLHAPSRLGLTSPVAGDLGRFLVDQQNQVQVQSEQLDHGEDQPRARAGGRLPYRDFAMQVRRAARWNDVHR